MTSKRVPLALVLCTVLFVTSGFAATKKFDRHRLASEEWNDSPLMSATLLSTGSSVPTDGGSASLSLGSLSPPSLVLSPGTPDNWNGGMGNWSDAGNWSTGFLPGPANDVTIDTGNDDVNLDTDLVSINTLTIGDASGSANSSKLEGGVAGGSLTIAGAFAVNKSGYVFLNYVIGDVGTIENSGSFSLHGGDFKVTGDVNNSGDFNLIHADLEAQNLTNNKSFTLSMGGSALTVSGALTNNAGATFSLIGNADVANIGTLANKGYVFVGNSSTLNLTNQAGGITDIVAGSAFGIAGTFWDTQNDASAIANLKTVEGTLVLENQTTPFIFNLTINSGGTVNLIGTILNTSDFVNHGSIQVNGGSNLGYGGDLTNASDGTITTGSLSGGNQIDADTLANYGMIMVNGSGDQVGGSLMNGDDKHTGASFSLNGSHATANLLSIENYGSILVESGSLPGTSSLMVSGDVTNSGTISTQPSNDGSPNVIMITGMLTNSGTFQLNGPGDMATLGSLTNSGTVDVENGSTLKITGDVLNNGGLLTDFHNFGGGNDITISGMLTNSAGAGVSVNGGSTLSVTGDVDNSGVIYTNGGELSAGGNTLDIGGMLTNQSTGTFKLYGPGDEAMIDKGMSNAGFVDVEGGSTLHITGDVTNSGTLTTGLSSGGNTLTIGGMLTNESGAPFGLNGFGDVATLGSLNNAGNVVVDGGSTLNVTGDVSNSGALFTGPSLGGNTITVNGLLTNTATGTIALNGPGDVLQALAGLSNSGVINVNNGSLIDPPFLKNGGTINIDSTSRLVVGTPTPMGGQGYIQLHNGTLTEIISDSSFGVINVNGSALLDGTLAILLQGSTPAEGSTYKFLIASPGELSGMFSNVPDPELWAVIYDYADGYVEAKFLPEPATLLVLIPGLLGVAYGLRRKLLA